MYGTYQNAGIFLCHRHAPMDGCSIFTAAIVRSRGQSVQRRVAAVSPTKKALNDTLFIVLWSLILETLSSYSQGRL